MLKHLCSAISDSGVETLQTSRLGSL